MLVSYSGKAQAPLRYSCEFRCTVANNVPGTNYIIHLLTQRLCVSRLPFFRGRVEWRVRSAALSNVRRHHDVFTETDGIALPQRRAGRWGLGLHRRAARWFPPDMSQPPPRAMTMNLILGDRTVGAQPFSF